MNQKQTYLLALLSALLLWMAWPPFTWTTPLLLVALVPLLAAIDHILSNHDKKRGKKVFLTAGLAFLVWNTASIYWVFNAIHSSDTGWLVSLLVSLIPYGLGALLMTFAFWLYAQLRTRVRPVLAYAGLIAFYISMEYLHQSWDLAFPWMTLGNGLAGMHQLAQWYSYTGTYGGSLWILLSNILVFEAYRGWKQDQGKWMRLLACSSVVLIPMACSLFTYSTYQEKILPVNVVAVQPNIDPYEKYSSASAAEQLNVLIKLSDSVGQVNTEYFIWPETALPQYANEEQIRSHPDVLAAQQFLGKYKNGTLITGIETIKWYDGKQTISAGRDERSGKYYDRFNAALQLENSAAIAIYHKSKLVPGVEKMPFPKVFSFLAPVFEHLGGSASGYGWQQQPTVFYAQSGIGVAPVICYESIWGNWIAKSVKEGAQFIAIITNDGWWGNTSGKDQHLLYAKLRAIETRRWVVRSANTGISAFINQRGDVVKQSEWWKRTALKADINLNDSLTFYAQNGDIIPQVAIFLGILLALVIPYQKWRSKNKKTLGYEKQE
ncbi:MAG: apolipoprotein N-acyltransferase [Pedobacter sp.]|nr:apolipoprotein N-acyltransferase [Pedobacter sp.]MDQ8053629.1 apolipoprotein N-acyltransferase [Pedobacter sp.]